jgi:cellobiose phosphorylase/N,N'-diacetylchitobiose phosphorylase
LNFKGFFASSVKSKRTGELSDDNNCSAFEIDIELEAGQSREVLFVAGIFFDKQELETLSCKYTKQKADEAFDAMKRYWDDVINKNVNIKTGCKEIDLWCNIRLKSLLYNTKRWTRGLDRGYRDILQDLRGFLMIDPGEVKNKLLEALSFQYGDGRALRQYSAVGTEHDRRDYSDSPIWIADVLTSYIKESGDMEILQKQVPFFDGGSGSVYEHNLRAIKYLLDDRGAHGLCRLRYGDWNDALEGIGKKGFAEGVWLSMALYWSMKLTRELAAFIGDFQTSGYLANSMRQVKDAVNEFGWQGRWYAYALDDEGEAIGSPDNQEGKLHLNPQSFAVFTGIADDERAGLCMEAVDQYLETDFGPLLVWPCYKNEKIGRIWRMEPGTFENGSMYFHGAAFKMLAEAAAGRSDAAVDTFLKVLPSNPQNPPARSTIEPYALGNYYCGRDNQLAGLNIYSHFTGSYSWMLKCIIEYVIGVKADYNGLRIEPALPQDWDEVEIFRRFRGRQYQICIKRSADVPGSYDIYVNGKRHNIDGLPVIIY